MVVRERFHPSKEAWKMRISVDQVVIVLEMSFTVKPSAAVRQIRPKSVHVELFRGELPH